MNNCFTCQSKPAEKNYRNHGVTMTKRVCADCFANMVEPLFITVNFSDFTEGTYTSIQEAEDAVLEAHASNVSVEYIQDDDGNIYSCEWDVVLQKES